MLNAPAGVARAMARLHQAKSERSTPANRFRRRPIGALRGLGMRLAVFVHLAPLAARPAKHPRSTSIRRSMAVRLSSERILPIIAATVVLGASLVSFQPAAAAGSTGSVDGPGTAPRIAIGGTSDQLDPIEMTAGLGTSRSVSDQPDLGVPPVASYADDGTLYKPVAVNTVVADGSGLLQTYTVKSGDTLTGVASHYGISMMTLWWANKLTAKDELHVGQKLTIPPVSGLVVTVKQGDTLESLATQYKVDGADILAVNQLEDPNLIIGQVLTLPDAAGAPIPTPKPGSRSRASVTSTSCANCSGGTYGGGAFAWPVVGGDSYVSQPFRYGHYGLDIAATYGSRVISASEGVVTFAGWKNNGGGYQVWISIGSDLYATYNHMSAVSVSAGQTVGRGQQVGRIGQSGDATGPHLHFEVWIGSIWNGGYRVNPRRYI